MVSWLDYVIYSDDEREFDLSQINEAVLGFALSMSTQDAMGLTQPSIKIEAGSLDASWEQLHLQIPARPTISPPNL